MSSSPETNQLPRIVSEADSLSLPTVSPSDISNLSADNERQVRSIEVASNETPERGKTEKLSDMSALTQFLHEAMPGAEHDIEEYKRFIYLHVRNYIEVEYLLRTERRGGIAHDEEYHGDVDLDKLRYLLELKRATCLDEIRGLNDESAYSIDRKSAYVLNLHEDSDKVGDVSVRRFRVLTDSEIRTILENDPTVDYKRSDSEGRQRLIQEYRDERSPITDRQVYGKLLELSDRNQLRLRQENSTPARTVSKIDHDPRLDTDSYADIMSVLSGAADPIEKIERRELVDFKKYGNKPLSQFTQEQISAAMAEYRQNNQLYIDTGEVKQASIDMEAIFNSVINDIQSSRQEFEKIISDFKTIYGENWVMDQLGRFNSLYESANAELESGYGQHRVNGLARYTLSKLHLGK